jgi:hypothetical protein
MGGDFGLRVAKPGNRILTATHIGVMHYQHIHLVTLAGIMVGRGVLKYMHQGFLTEAKGKTSRNAAIFTPLSYRLC